MASMTMTVASSYVATFAAAKQLPTGVRRGTVVVRASSTEPEKMVKAESSGRRDLVFGMTAAAAAALCSVAVAVAEEPRRGSADAREKYSPVCVTMPTARICHR